MPPTIGIMIMKTSLTTTKPALKPSTSFAADLVSAAKPDTKAATKSKPVVASKIVEPTKVFKIANIMTSGKHLRAYWIASMQASGAWNGKEVAPRAFHWSLSSKTAFTYHVKKGTIAEGTKGGYKLVQKGKSTLMDKVDAAMVDGYLAIIKTGEITDFKPATVASAKPSIFATTV